MDHLDGTLFVDRLRGLQKDLIVRKIKKLDAPANGSGTLRVVFFGTPQFAVPTLEALLASRHAVVRRRHAARSAARPRPAGDRRAGQGAGASSAALPVLQPATLRDAGGAPSAARLAARPRRRRRLRPDHSRRRCSRVPRLGMINVHASLLPKYRGAAPVHRAVIDGETETGVTIMRVAPKLDAGAMFATTTRPIGPDETSDGVEDALAALGARPARRRRRRASPPAPRTRSRRTNALATYAPRLTKDEGLIDWTLPAPRIHNRVRGLYPVAARLHATSTARRVIVLASRRRGRRAGDGAARAP